MAHLIYSQCCFRLFVRWTYEIFEVDVPKGALKITTSTFWVLKIAHNVVEVNVIWCLLTKISDPYNHSFLEIQLQDGHTDRHTDTQKYI